MKIWSALALVLAMTGPTQAQRLAEAPWWERSIEATSEYYWIKSDLPRADAQSIARHLDRMYEEYSKRLASLPPRAPVKLNVYLFQRQRDYELTLRARFGVNATGTGGLFFASGGHHGLAIWVEHLSERRIKHVIQHEGFHQFAWSRFGGDLPNWVNEGLAEFFGMAVLLGDRLVIGQSNQRTLERLKDRIERKTYLSFQDMISMTNPEWMAKVNAGDSGPLYDQAWSMVHFLVYAQEGRYTEAFERYLRLINNGLPFGEAFSRAFETSETEAFEERWKEFIITLKPGGFITALERIEFLAEGSLQLAQEGIYPESLEALRTALRDIRFTHSFTGHSRMVQLDAADDEVFRIPGSGNEDGDGIGNEADEGPAFEVGRPNLRKLRLRDRKLEQAHPSPSIISTRNLEPRNLVVEWIRDRDDPSVFSYQIRVP